MRKKLSLIGGVIGAAVLLLAGCSGGGTGGSPQPSEGGLADMEPIVLKLAEANAEATGQGAAVVRFMDYIEEQTDGKVTFEPYWSSALFPYQEALTSTGSGLADVAAITAAFTPEELPALTWLNGVGTMQGTAWPASYLQAHGATIDLIENNEELQAELTDHNVKSLWLGNSPRADLYCKDPIGTDLTGLRVRVVAALYGAQIEALGGTPVNMPLTEVYEALERGVIDCVSVPSGFMTIPQMGISDLAPHFGALDMASNLPNGYIINLDVWNSFPEDLKEIFNEGSAVFAAAMAETFIDGYAQVAQDADGLGLDIADVTSANQTLAAFNEEALAKLPDSAPASITDAEGLIEDYQSLLDEWMVKIGDDMGLATDDPDSADALVEQYSEGADVFDADAFAQLLAG